MSQNKIPGQLTEQELLNLLSDDKVKEQNLLENSPNSPIKFLTIFNILPGKFIIKTSALHSFYKKWHGKHPMLRTTFVSEVKNYLPYNPKKSCFSINESVINLSQRFTIENFKRKDSRKQSTKLLKFHIEKFLEEFQLKRGNKFVELNEVHIKYWDFCVKTKKSKRLFLDVFKNVMKLYFNIIEDQHGKTMIGFEKYGEKENEEEKKD